MTTKIKATNIWKKFNNLEVLKGIDLEVNEGEVVAVIGPSGGGKSTLLRCLNKLETIDKGSITIDGEELCRETSGGTEYVKNNDVRRIACKMGMVFQQFNLFENMNVMKNLTVAPMRIHKMPQAEAEANRQAAERARAAAPVIIPPTEEERQLKEEAAREARSNAFITASGRLDCEVLQQFATPAVPARKRYRFWVDFTPEDIEWFKAEAQKRGFAYGSVK